MKLYFIAYYDGDSWDLFVWAETKDQAIRLWYKYYETMDLILSKAIVYEVPTQAPATAQAVVWRTDIKPV